ncbi:helix-turn-helix domain-containing protein [Saccharothrix sp. 6-C]|uniref:AraC-like ligand-binding domain-containing protein n=1 Tax=Saccharothrix sp. 6-C TaxID=2781735 RepID=UPI001917513F|nr:helix-turn-helix domain-containing protein [Saccharothrix sp. 6-C]QQQ80170.1 helix-turn-helix domain-containing protein [Saccharothrix sp. 6-C]
MLQTVLHTEDLPVADRFDCWHQTVSRTIIPTWVRTEAVADFRASARVLDAGGMHLSTETVMSPLQADRTPKLIRQSDPEQYLLGVILQGENYGLTQSGRDATFRAGDLLLFDSSRPFRARYTGGSHLMLRFSRRLLPLPPSTVDQLLVTPLQGREGIGALLSNCLREVAGATEYQPAGVSHLLNIAVDLLAVLLAYELAISNPLPPERHHEALLARIHAFINEHLGDPALSPGMIASAHHISLRQLHRLFQNQDTTVAARIRRQRLERCHRDLADPRLQTHPIHAIAARWGFSEAAHFSRAFRAAFGMPPADYRRMTLHRAPGHEQASTRH